MVYFLFQSLQNNTNKERRKIELDFLLEIFSLVPNNKFILKRDEKEELFTLKGFLVTRKSASISATNNEFLQVLKAALRIYLLIYPNFLSHFIGYKVVGSKG